MLRRRFAGLSAATRSEVQRWIRDGRVRLNGAPVRRTSSRPAVGDVVTVALPDAAVPRAPHAEPAVLDLLYEDDHLLVLNKAAGVVVHPTYAHTSGTVLNGLLWHGRGWTGGRRPSIVGRLDKLTSGLVLVAKSAPAHAGLQRAVAARDAAKDYLAVVYGRVDVASGRIDVPLARDRADRRRVVAAAGDGRPSLTLFERLAHVPTPPPGLSLLRCRLMTGRMHQIRVHLHARGWPIVGDPVYGPSSRARNAPDQASFAAAFSRQALHAWRLSLTHPMTQEPLFVEAPLPQDYTALLEAAGLVVPGVPREGPDGGGRRS